MLIYFKSVFNEEKSKFYIYFFVFKLKNAKFNSQT